MSRFLRKSFSFFLIFLLTENCIDSREEGEGIKSGGNEGWHIEQSPPCRRSGGGEGARSLCYCR